MAGGMGHGQACGSAYGAILGLGLVYGKDPKIAAKVKEFVRRFEAANGALACQDLTGVDMSDMKNLVLYFARGTKKKTCNGAVASAVQIALELVDDLGV